MKITRYALLLLCFSVLHADEITWQDSAPFSKTIVAQGVHKDSLVTLEPIYALDGNDIQLENFTLEGFDWVWPFETIPLGRVEDIDVRTRSDSTDLYLVTDSQREAGKLFVFNPRTNIIVWNYNGSALESPVDTYEFVENNHRYFLVTDRGNHRVMQIDEETQSVVWSYGDSLGRGGSGFNQLDDPADAQRIANSTQYVIADKGNDRVIIVEQADHSIVWQMGPEYFNNPVDVEYPEGGDNILVTDQGNNRVVMVSRANSTIVWQFPDPAGEANPDHELSSPIDADLLENGHVLIADAGNNRVVEVNPSDSEYFWELQLPLVGLRDVDQIGSGSRNHDKLMVVNINDSLGTTVPSRVGFASGWRESPIYTVNKEVNFDSLFWNAMTNQDQNTSLELQFRSGTSLSDIQLNDWIGPDSTSATTYKTSGAKLPDIHRSHSFYQYRAFLQTSSPKETPVLNDVTVKYYYYNTGTISPRPYFWASNIGIVENDSLVPHWISFEAVLKLPEDPVKRSALDLLFRIIENKQYDPPQQSYRTLYEFSVNMDSTVNTLKLEDISELWGISSINLNGYPSTRNTAVTPALVSWKLVYELVETSSSTIRFVDFNDNTNEKVYGYVAFAGKPGEGQTPDQVGIYLDDDNLEKALSKFEVPVKALISGDQETIKLDRQQTYFKNSTGMPITISNTVSPFNDTLEVTDRDTLLVEYQDVNDLTDISSDRVLVVMATDGEIYIENSQGSVIQNVEFGQDLFVRVKNENDKNLDLVKQDSLKVTLEDKAQDLETVWLYEVPNGDGIYNTGEFINRTGIPVTDKTVDLDGKNNDGRLQTSYGATISAIYIDNIELEKRVNLPSQPNITINWGGKPYIALVAPNPYYEKDATNFRMRVASAHGSIRVRKVQVYDLSGEKVREIDGSELKFSYDPIPIAQYGEVEHWWDLRNDSGQQVSSGTYFLKVHAELTLEDTGQVENIAIYQKFMVVR